MNESQTVKHTVKTEGPYTSVIGRLPGDTLASPSFVATGTPSGMSMLHRRKNSTYTAGRHPDGFIANAYSPGKRKHGVLLHDNGSLIAETNGNASKVIVRPNGVVNVFDMHPKTKIKRAIGINHQGMNMSKQDTMSVTHWDTGAGFQSCMICTGPDGKRTKFNYSHQTGQYTVSVDGEDVDEQTDVELNDKLGVGTPVQPHLDDLL